MSVAAGPLENQATSPQPSRYLPLSGLMLAAWIMGAGSAHGVARPARQSDSLVRIGLLVAAAGGDSARARDARRGAELAVKQWNARGGVAGRPVALVVRTMEGPWGSGSKAVVDLVFGERVHAILESLDGRGAHVAEQIVTKSQTPMLSAWATDVTLAGAFVPWYFRVVPDDRRQAAALAREIYGARRYRRVAVAATEAYDARVAARAFARQADSLGRTVTLDLTYRDGTAEVEALVDRIARSAVDALVLFGPPARSLTLIRRMAARGLQVPTFASLPFADALLCDSCRKDVEGVVFVAPGHWYAPSGRALSRAFEATYGTPPGAAAAYAYDGTRVLLGAIERAGLDRTRIQYALRQAGPWQGVTGVIQFDERGNRGGSVELLIMRGGKPHLLGAGRSGGGQP